MEASEARGFLNALGITARMKRPLAAIRRLD